MVDVEAFADVQLSGDNPERTVATINYTQEYKVGMQIYRALRDKHEYSERALQLTGDLVLMNPSNYSVWEYRYTILVHLGRKWMAQELPWMDAWDDKHIKAYQVWQHRRRVVTELDNSVGQLSMAKRILEEDAKNYHTWVYRHWVLEYFYLHPENRPVPPPETSSRTQDEQNCASVIHSELASVDELLTSDPRNNSAWAYRFFLFFQSGFPWDTPLDERVSQEVNVACDLLEEGPENASAWAYLRGVSRLHQVAHERVKVFASQWGTRKQNVDIYAGDTAANAVVSRDHVQPLVFYALLCEDDHEWGVAAATYEELIRRDPMHQEFWAYKWGDSKTRAEADK